MDAIESTVKGLTPGTQIAVKGSFEDLNQTLADFYPLFSSDGYYYTITV